MTTWSARTIGVPRRRGGVGSAARGVGKTYNAPWTEYVSDRAAAGRGGGTAGPNGAGNTTFDMIIGLVKPDTGTINLDGADSDQPADVPPRPAGIEPIRRGGGSSFRGLMVEQNVTAVLEVGEPDANRAIHAGRTAGRVRDQSSAGATPLAPSGGERRGWRLPAPGDQPAEHPAGRADRRYRPDPVSETAIRWSHPRIAPSAC